MNTTDPIIIPEDLWTKETIFEQLDNDVDLTVDDISDEDAIEWVRQEADIKFDAISYGEDYYGRTVSDLNSWLVQKSKK